MGIFGNINDAKVSSGGVFFVPGDFDVEVKAVKAIKPRKGGVAVVVETKIEKSDVESRPAGSSCTYYIPLDNADVGPANMKRFLAEVMGVDAQDDTQDWEAIAELAISDDQPLAGQRIHISCYRKAKAAFRGEDDALTDQKKSYLAYRFHPLDAE